MGKVVQLRKRCASTNSTGAPCANRAVLDDGFCVFHTPQSDVVRSRFLAGPDHTNGPGATSKFDLWRAQILEEFDEWVQPYRQALNAKVTAAYQGVVTISDVVDAGAGVSAAEKVFDRLFFKPAQRTEVTGAAGGPIEIAEVPLDSERAEAVAAILRSTGAVA